MLGPGHIITQENLNSIQLKSNSFHNINTVNLERLSNENTKIVEKIYLLHYMPLWSYTTFLFAGV